jgi:phosphoribosylaminoimidazole carboxylase (NCAIR synthetase)
VARGEASSGTFVYFGGKKAKRPERKRGHTYFARRRISKKEGWDINPVIEPFIACITSQL